MIKKIYFRQGAYIKDARPKSRFSDSPPPSVCDCLKYCTPSSVECQKFLVYYGMTFTINAGICPLKHIATYSQTLENLNFHTYV